MTGGAPGVVPGFDVPEIFAHQLRRQLSQNDRARPRHPDSDEPVRAILLSHYDPDWRNGRIGQWIRAYRPDLLR